MATSTTAHPAQTPGTHHVFRGWFVVAAGFIIMATCYTTFINTMSLFQARIVEDLGITIAQYNFTSSISTLMSIVGAAGVGMLADRVSSRVLGCVAVTLASLTLVALSAVTQVWQLYVLFAVAGMVVLSGLRLLISLVAANWFTAKRGLAISIALSGSGFGGAILSPIVSSAIVTYGWRVALLILAAICFVASFPVTAFAFHTHPSELGLEPYGEGETAAEAQSPEAKTDTDFAGRGWEFVRRHSSFWLLAGAFLLMGVVNVAVLGNQVTNMTSVTMNGEKIITGGHDLTWAGTVMSVNLVTVVIAKISLGAIYDRFGLRFGNVLGSVACIVASVALCFPATNVGPYVAAVAFGIGTCMGTVAPTVAASKLYGMRDLGKVSGMITSIEMAGGVAGALLSGLMFDTARSFVPVWIMCGICSAVMLVGLLAAEAKAVRQGGSN